MNQHEEDEINEKYLCSICQNLYVNPKIIVTCQHSFCSKCIDDLTKNEKSPSCPLCRKRFLSKNIQSNNDLIKEISSQKITCKCKKVIALSMYEEHTSICPSFNSNLKTHIKTMVIKDSKETVNRSTFKCPLCNVTNLSREGLLKHVQQNHRQGLAVCPICSVQPWGDPNYVTDLYGHMNKRHKFDYETTVDYNNDEDAVLQEILQKSLNDY